MRLANEPELATTGWWRTAKKKLTCCRCREEIARGSRFYQEIRGLVGLDYCPECAKRVFKPQHSQN